MAYMAVIDCTRDVNIHRFLNSEQCKDHRIQPIYVDDVNKLPQIISQITPTCVILSSNTTSIPDMYDIVTKWSNIQFILCVGDIKIKKNKLKLKLLQDQYKCYIIESVVTDFLLLNFILDCMANMEVHKPNVIAVPQVEDDIVTKHEKTHTTQHNVSTSTLSDTKEVESDQDTDFVFEDEDFDDQDENDDVIFE